MGQFRNTEKLLDTTFWLEPWLKSSIFGYNFFHLAKVLATTHSEPVLALIACLKKIVVSDHLNRIYSFSCSHINLFSRRKVNLLNIVLRGCIAKKKRST